mgnify:FL=1
MEVTNLKAYLANTGQTLKDFCRMLDCDMTYMSAVMNGRVRAGRRLAKDVRIATGGTIRLESKLKKRHQRQGESQTQNESASAA